MLYFYANDGVNGTELWKSDGTEIGTNMVTDLNNGSDSGYFFDAVEISGHLYFRGNNGTTWSLWKTNGTDEGTNLAIDFSLGKNIYGYERNVMFSPDEFVVHENDVYFIVYYSNVFAGSNSVALYWFDLRHH
jgi:ELWxxDGT repeat protein